MNSWNEIGYFVFAVVFMGCNQALNVCQWVHEHKAERVSGIPAANRFTDFVAVPLPSTLAHTEYVDSFVGLSEQLVLPGRDFRLGVRPDEAGCWGVSPWTWRLRVAMLRVVSLGWARTSSVVWLVISSFGLWCGERASGFFLWSLRTLSMRRPSKTAHKGCMSFGWQRACSFWLIVTCRRRGVLRYRFLMPLHGVVWLSLLRYQPQ